MNPYWLFPISVAVSVLGSMIGAGGGFLLVPIMLLAYPDESPAIVTFISLCTVLLNAMSATLRYARMQRIDFRSGLAFGSATVLPAVIGVIAVRRVDTRSFSPVFGVFLVVVALLLVRKLFMKPRCDLPPRANPEWTRRCFKDTLGVEHVYSFSMPLALTFSGLVGFISSFFGIGGGIVHVPIMTQVLGFPVFVATATSVLVLLISTFCGVVTHVISMMFTAQAAEGAPVAVSLVLKQIGAAGAGALIGGQIGARIAHRISGRNILLILAAALCVAGVRLLMRAFS